MPPSTTFIAGYSTAVVPEPPDYLVEPLVPYWGPFLVWIVYFVLILYLAVRRPAGPMPFIFLLNAPLGCWLSWLGTDVECSPN